MTASMGMATQDDGAERMLPSPIRVAHLLAMALLLLVPLSVLAQQQIHPPLRTSGHEILDSAAHVVRLTSVNWYGFDQKEYVAGGLDHAPLATIIREIHAIGVNSVRLPWANETLEHNPLVADYAVKANPQFRGKHALEVMDAVIAALARAQIMVILDNHVSRADWCCKDEDGNGLWYNEEYPEEKWLVDWESIVRRYKNQPTRPTRLAGCTLPRSLSICCGILAYRLHLLCDVLTSRE
jgi:endoglucanase